MQDRLTASAFVAQWQLKYACDAFHCVAIANSADNLAPGAYAIQHCMTAAPSCSNGPGARTPNNKQCKCKHSIWDFSGSHAQPEHITERLGADLPPLVPLLSGEVVHQRCSRPGEGRQVQVHHVLQAPHMHG